MKGVEDDQEGSPVGATEQAGATADEEAVEAELPTLDMGAVVVGKSIELSKDVFAQMREVEEEEDGEDELSLIHI